MLDGDVKSCPVTYNGLVPDDLGVASGIREIGFELLYEVAQEQRWLKIPCSSMSGYDMFQNALTNPELQYLQENFSRKWSVVTYLGLHFNSDDSLGRTKREAVMPLVIIHQMGAAEPVINENTLDSCWPHADLAELFVIHAGPDPLDIFPTGVPR